MTDVLDELDRRIAAALQLDGRAPWKRIARALGQQERTVTRRGTRLIAEGLVRVAGYTVAASGTVVGVWCAPGQVRVTGRAFAQRADTHYCHGLAGPIDVVAEVSCPTSRLPALVMDELPAIPGQKQTQAWPIMRYIRTAHQWRPQPIGDDATAVLLESAPEPVEIQFGEIEELDSAAQTIVQALGRNGRCSHDELARLTGMSSATVRRRIGSMRREGRLLVRAVIDPALLGYPVKALLWLRTAPEDVNDVARSLAAEPFVRYAVYLSGDRQFLVEVAVSTIHDLDRVTTQSDWIAKTRDVEVSFVIATFKRSGVLVS